MATESPDIRYETDMALSRVVRVFGAAKPHHAHLFANRHVTRMKVLLHDSIDVSLCAHRVHQDRFAWSTDIDAPGALQAASNSALVSAE